MTVLISVLLYKEVLGQLRLRMSVKINRQEEVHTDSPLRNACRLLEDHASKLYKYIVRKLTMSASVYFVLQLV